MCWHYDMETLSALLAPCQASPLVIDGSLHGWPAKCSFDVFFDVSVTVHLVRSHNTENIKTSHEKINGHRELTVSSQWARWSLIRGPMITAQSRLGEVTAQSRQGHSSVTARSQPSHGEITAQSRHLQYDHGSVTARSQLNHGPGHGSVTAGLWPFWSPWAHGELTVSSRWAVTVATSPSVPRSHQQVNCQYNGTATKN